MSDTLPRRAPIHTPNLLRDERAAAPLVWLRKTLAGQAKTHPDLCTDSRTVEPGDAFMAYAVEGADNRIHIADAVSRGAAAVLFQPDDTMPPPATGTVPSLRVPGLDALAGVIAAEWYGAPGTAMAVIGVTGTNGKTSSTLWIAQALAALKVPAGVIGTLGVGIPPALEATGFTTPNAAQLQRSLARIRAEGAEAVAMEVSSHALQQGRINGTAFDVAVFTNLSQDHLDFHGTMQAYEQVKRQLFDWPGLRYAVVNADDAAGRRLLAHVNGRVATIACVTEGTETSASAKLASAGRHAAAAPAAYLLRATAIAATPNGGTTMTLTLSGGADAAAEPLTVRVEVAQLGHFNVQNLLGVMGAVIAADDARGRAPSAARFAEIAATLAYLPAVPGRMQKIGGRVQADEPLVVIDYAHTPDALEKVLIALRPVTASRGGALWVVFGCGGNRDEGKRPLMGAIAARHADATVLTSDNPRGENPAAIIDAIAAGMPAEAIAPMMASGTAAMAATASPPGIEARDATGGLMTPHRYSIWRIEDRASAILQTVRASARDDVVLLAGKGHEATQEIMGKKRPFSDEEHARLALAARLRQVKSVPQARGDSL